ncbi:hypothetical protein V2P20_03745 [Methylobacter sp. Wu1]|uniref:hypothetical protein n=1 Tax=Methylobacter sp. Wu1 TaxID=3119359 RepID=UPI002F935BD9
MHQLAGAWLLQRLDQTIALGHVILAKNQRVQREFTRLAAQILGIGQVAFGVFVQHGAPADFALGRSHIERHAAKRSRLHGIPPAHQRAPGMIRPASTL